MRGEAGHDGRLEGRRVRLGGGLLELDSGLLGGGDLGAGGVGGRGLQLGRRDPGGSSTALKTGPKKGPKKGPKLNLPLVRGISVRNFKIGTEKGTKKGPKRGLSKLNAIELPPWAAARRR